MKRRDFLGLFSAALVATKITSTGETVPTPTRAEAPLPTPQTGVIGRKLYRQDGKYFTVIATAGPDDHAWTYISGSPLFIEPARTKKKHAKKD